MMPTPRPRRFRLILAAVDFSKASRRALQYAAATARVTGGRVVAIHALDPLLSAAAARAYAERALISDAETELARFVRQTLGAGEARAVECSVVVGPARQVLMQESRRRHSDAVVLGTNGRSGIAKVFFGSTTEALLRRYHGAVMVVSPRVPSPGKHWPDGRMVAAILEGPHRRAMVSAAARTAAVFGAWLTVATAVPKSIRSGGHPALIVLPLPDGARLRTFGQGTRAYEFVRRAGAPVLVVHAGRRIGHANTSARAA
jgi:nucleotide-binding universal stress UspA family protein